MDYTTIHAANSFDAAHIAPLNSDADTVTVGDALTYRAAYRAALAHIAANGLAVVKRTVSHDRIDRWLDLSDGSTIAIYPHAHDAETSR